MSSLYRPVEVSQSSVTSSTSQALTWREGELLTSSVLRQDSWREAIPRRSATTAAQGEGEEMEGAGGRDKVSAATFSCPARYWISEVNSAK